MNEKGQYLLAVGISKTIVPNCETQFPSLCHFVSKWHKVIILLDIVKVNRIIKCLFRLT